MKKLKKHRPMPYLQTVKLAKDKGLDKSEIKRGVRRKRAPVIAPEDLRLLDNTNTCISFFNELRNPKNCSILLSRKKTQVDLTNVKKIDYAAINILIAIARDLKNKRVIMEGTFPKDSNCKDMMIESGFLKYLYCYNRSSHINKSSSDIYFFKKGVGKLSDEDTTTISRIVRKSVKHLTNTESKHPLLRSLLLEICGNSIEHSNSAGQLWLLGVKYEPNQVLFSFTDIGLGILKTICRKNSYLVKELLKSDIQILEGAFDKKYGSRTKESNRNKGLPFIKVCAKEKMAENLIVITNGVSLYVDDSKSKHLNDEFGGTTYQWQITKSSLAKKINFDYGDTN